MKLLLAEDTRDLNRALTAVLSRNDYEVDAVYDGAAASERLEEETYDVIVLDIMMPKKDGLQVLADLRAQNIMTPVLLGQHKHLKWPSHLAYRDQTCHHQYH